MAQQPENTKKKEPTEAVTIRVPVSMNERLSEKLGKDRLRSRHSIAIEAFEAYLDEHEAKPVLGPNSDTTLVDGDILSSRERAFLRECLRIYRSDFGKPLQENVKFFGIGLSAIEKIAAMEASRNERSSPDAPGTGELRAATLLDHAENEARLLKKAAHDAAEKRGGSGARDQEAPGGAEPRRKSGPRKAGSGSGD